MSRPKSLEPSYCHHRSSGRAYVTINGKPVYLGQHGSQESRDRYRVVVAEWIAQGRQTLPHPIHRREQRPHRLTHPGVILEARRRLLPQAQRKRIGRVGKLQTRHHSEAGDITSAELLTAGMIMASPQDHWRQLERSAVDLRRAGRDFPMPRFIYALRCCPIDGAGKEIGEGLIEPTPACRFLLAELERTRNS